MLNKSLNVLIEKFIPQVEIDKQKIDQNLLSSPALINTLRQVIGYDNVKQLVPLIKKMKPDTIDELKQLVSENTTLTVEFLNKWFDPSNLTSYTELEPGEKNGNSLS